MQTNVEAYTDGSCQKNPGGPGGWGYVLYVDGKKTQENCGGEAKTTSNRMELMAAIQAVSATLAIPTTANTVKVTVFSDSKYVVCGITSWIQGWKRNGWKTASKTPVANQDLWKQLDALVTNKQIKFIHVAGHTGIEGNELADHLANLGCQSAATAV